jgi:hypothetical protein
MSVQSSGTEDLRPFWLKKKTRRSAATFRTGVRLTLRSFLYLKIALLRIHPSHIWQNVPLMHYFAILSVKGVLEPVSETLSKALKWQKKSWSGFSRRNTLKHVY